MSVKKTGTGDGFLEDVVDAAVPDGVDSALDGMEALGEFIPRLHVLFESAFWRRVGFILAGVALIGVALALFARDFAGSSIGRALKS